MAIQSFSLCHALDSSSYAYKCWYNYNHGNTLGISDEDYGRITQTWQHELTAWQATASKDTNDYEISDDDFNMHKANGRSNAEAATGYDGNNAGSMAHSIGDAAVTVTANVMTNLAKGVVNKAAGAVGKAVVEKLTAKTAEKVAAETAKNIGKKVTEKAAGSVGMKIAKGTSAELVAKTAGEEAAKKAGATAAEKGVAGFVKNAAEKASAKAAAKASEKGAEAAAEAGKNAGDKVTKAGKNIGWIITAPIALATGTAYMAKKPNKDEHQAAKELQPMMGEAQADLYDAEDKVSHDSI